MTHKSIADEKICISKKPVAVVGWSGYSGLELCRLILSHPHMELAAVYARSLDLRVSDLLPTAPAIPVHPLEKLDEGVDCIFFATPAEVSRELVSKLIGKKTKIIDLSGAFRLESDFVYGLQPWQKLTSNLIANPGCYVTSVLMALIPLLKMNLLDPSTLVVDAKSGVTGAGKSPKTDLLFAEVADNCLPYKVANHQHLPEIVHYLKTFSNVETAPFFTTHLLPVKRGIISSIYARTQATEQQITQAYQEFYSAYPLVKFAALEKNAGLMRLDQVVGSARTHISFKVHDQKLYLFSCIDNLLKGAASQAIENWNALHQLSVTTALETL